MRMHRACSRSLTKKSTSRPRVCPSSNFYPSSLFLLYNIFDLVIIYEWPIQLNAPLEAIDPEIADIIELEIARAYSLGELHFGLCDVVRSVITKKYSEGYPGTRYYGGNEMLSQKCALEASRLDLEKWETDTKKICDVSFFFETMLYRLNESTRYIEYHQAKIVAGASAYARLYDYECIHKVCKKQKAIMLANMAHISGLVTVDMIPSPFDYTNVMTTTTHKSLLGPRGAMIFFKKGLKEINKQGKEAIFPRLPKRPHNHIITGLAVALKQIHATTPDYKAYQEQALYNCSKFAESLAEKGYRLVFGGTENHLVLVNLKNKGIDGSRVKKVLKFVPITANKNIVPCTRKAITSSFLKVSIKSK
ncbi:hypothetical protein UlMin_028933 [Ulmus minor]